MKIPFNKQITNEKGAIATLVVVTVIMFVVILTGIYFGITSLESAQLKSDIKIKKLYQDDVNNIDNIYTELVSRYDDPYIPKGFTHIEGTWNNGYVIRETSTGNEFVWVPCVLDQNLVKGEDIVVNFERISNGSYNPNSYMLQPNDNSANEIRQSVARYGGFYIARYEAGIEGTVNNANLTTKVATDGTVKPLSKIGCGLWNYISRTDAIAVSNQMIDSETTGVHSCLISGEAWDTTINWMVNSSDNKILNAHYETDSGNKGWYNNVSNNSIHTTGYYAVNNIYDMAGNVWELTSEDCLYYNNLYGVMRGGCYNNSGYNNPSANRYYKNNDATADAGFRVVLYK